jgi:diguanylate cyclase (GGDEF)-like protein
LTPGKESLKSMINPQALQKQVEVIWLPLAFVLLLGIGYLDYLTQTTMTFSLFYMVPVALAAWHGGKRAGIILGIMGALVFFLAADILQGDFYHLATALWNTVMLLTVFLVIVHLLSSIKLLQHNEQKLVKNDTVTTAINSRYFYEVLQNEIDRAKRYARHFTLIYIDLDNFKKINEAFGRKEGDSALWHCVVTITGVLRKTDTIGRLGGDEFGCLLPETGFDAAGAVIVRLRAALEKEMVVHKWGTTISMGAVTFVKPPDKSDDALKMADSLMDGVKRAGKNGVEHKVYL